MRFIREFPFSILIVVAVLMLGAPFAPEPHLVEKARMAMSGMLTRPIDLFDVVWHLLPTAILIGKTHALATRAIDRKEKPPCMTPCRY